MGYTYTGIDGNPMIEFHVDNHPCLQEWANNKYGNFGGNISVRVTNQKPIIIFGQDESLFNQFSLGIKQWVGASGEISFLPKSEGIGIMAASFQSREFVFSMELTAEYLEKVNIKRARDFHYFNCVAAQDVNEYTKKNTLPSHPL